MEIKCLMLVSLCALIGKSWSQQCGTQLKNAVLREGDVNYDLPFTGKSPNLWSIATASEIFSIRKNITDNSGSVLGTFVKEFVTKLGALTILLAKTDPDKTLGFPYSPAGLYIRTGQSDNCVEAAKIAIAVGSPICEYIAISNRPGASRPAQVRCAMKYADANGLHPMYAILTLKRNGVALESKLPRPKYISRTVLLSEYYFSVDQSNGALTCEVRFKAPAPLPLKYVVQNQPTFSDECTVNRN